jgi:hypothetical protein
MSIFIHRDGETNGPYTLEEIQEHLGNGTLNENDFAWYEGLTEWAALSSIQKSRVVQLTIPVSIQLSARNRVYNSLEHQAIELLAYYIYVAEGRPNGKALQHWLEAEEQFEAECQFEAKSRLKPNILGGRDVEHLKI